MRTRVPFRAIPHQSELFLRYVENAPEALAFYRRPPTLDALERTARAEIGAAPSPRREMAAILRRQNRAFGSPPRVLELIDTLEHPDSVAIVTGQQAALFGGPLYTVFKAMTAARLATELRARGVPAVPVFWMDTEDHDLAEVARYARHDPGGVLESVDARPLLFPDIGEGTSHPVGDLRLPESIAAAARDLLAGAPETPDAGAARSRLEESYRPGSTLGEAFARLLGSLLAPSPLVLFDPHDPATKPLLSVLFQSAVRDADALHAALTERNRELADAGYHTQVHVLEGSTVLFLSEAGERRALTRHAGRITVKGGPSSIGASELADLARTAPERFSPNVLLRPVVQDSLFPTAAYVAGPAEIAYLAQAAVLYPRFGRVMPIVWPRASMTLLDRVTRNELDGAGLELDDCMAGKHRVVEKLVAASGAASAGAILQRLQRDIDAELEELRPAVAAAEGSLGDALGTARRKMRHQIAALETKLVHFEARRDHGIVQRADALLERCYPGRGLQERRLGILPILAAHGAAALARIDDAIEPARFEHRVVELG